ncbi:methylated-DNA--[protein]-cysteine S-methyltransferase [Demequina sediminicola]|uniref:methylated-DNA--[protein]-cysteine S-methyltransferase n=1 Tax=Demequina sediminicola TaxID=1095026 RepID=UPI000781D87C|nr:MGMT family protein [Demequina sediminicola]
METSPLTAAAYATPWGDLAVLADAAGAVHAAGMGTVRAVAAQRPVESAQRPWEPGEQPQIADALEQWLAGNPDAVTSIPVHLSGPDFLVEVWTHLRDVPGGAVVSYGELAEMAGRPRASRAVGTACARNRVGIFVPCHRVVQAGGRLGSYGFGGTRVKAQMLRLEGVEVRGDDEGARLIEPAEFRA